MELSGYVRSLRGELSTLTRFAGDDVTRIAEMLAESLDPAVRLTLMEVLSAAAAEITARLDEAVIDVRLASGEPVFVVTPTPHHLHQPIEPPAEADDAGTSRVTLRLSDGLKGRVEAAASAAGLSVNAWLVRAAGESLDPAPGGRGRSRPGMPGQRITGFHRS